MNRLTKPMLVAATAGTICLAQAAGAFALPAATIPDSGSTIVQTRGVAVARPGRGVAVARPGGAAVVRPGGGAAVVRPGGYRGGYYRPGYGGPVVVGGWRRPSYGWAPGGAIAAGAAIGVLSAAAAAAYASTPAPAAGLCWYYTDPTYSAGFWDVCR